ncbi:MAG: PQQ-dependent sugar dehydrogenase [Pseudomonadota bacterium]
MPHARNALKSAFAVLCAAATPAFAEDNGYLIETVVEGLDTPWSIAFLPDRTMLVTERPGRLLKVGDDGATTAISGVPDVYAEGQGGLFDAVPHPDFENNKFLYLVYAGGDDKENATFTARARLEDDALQDLEVLFKVAPLKDTSYHFGGRLVFLPDGTMVITTGDGGAYKAASQKLDSLLGKTIRLNADGTIPDDNPFVGRDDARPEIYSYGHRNPQGLIYDAASDTIYLHEHGPRGGDEINIVQPGVNYGWPIATYGVDYSGAVISPYTEYEGTEQPLLHWTPSIAPSGMAIYTGEMFPNWRGDILSGALAGRHVRRVDIENGAVAGQEELFGELEARIREVREGPDGALYIATDEVDARVLRVSAE